MPIGKSSYVVDILPAIWNSCAFPVNSWRAVDPYHQRRLWLLNAMLFLLLLGAVIGIDAAFNTLAINDLWQRSLGATAIEKVIFGIALVLVFGLLRYSVKVNYAGTGYQLDDGFIFIRSSFLFQRSYVVPLEKIQAVIFLHSPMQRRRDLVTIELDVNGILRPVRLFNVNREFAESLRSKALKVVNSHNT